MRGIPTEYRGDLSSVSKEKLERELRDLESISLEDDVPDEEFEQCSSKAEAIRAELNRR